MAPGMLTIKASDPLFPVHPGLDLTGPAPRIPDSGTALRSTPVASVVCLSLPRADGSGAPGGRAQ